jgi:outer membrane protein
MGRFLYLFSILTLLFSTACQTIVVPQQEIQKSLNSQLTLKITTPEGKLPKKMTMTQAKAYALKGNPNLHAAGQRILRAKAIIDQAKSLFYPTVSAESGATHQHHTPQGISGLSSDSYEKYTGHVTSQWLVFDGFIREYNLLAAEYGKVSSSESYKDTQRLLIDAVSQAFYETILASKEMDINLELRTINEDFLKDTRVKLEAGTATKTELNNFIVNVNDSRIAYLTAKNSFDTAKMALVELLGLPNANIDEFETTYKNSKVSVPKTDTAIERALNNRPDLKALQADILAIDAQIKQANGEYYPKVYLEGSYGAVAYDEARFGDNNRDSYFGAGVSWDIFTGNSTEALILQRTAEKDEQLKLLEAQWHQIITQIRQQRQSLLNVILRVEVQTESASLSKSIYEDTKEVYENGATTITRVNEVLTDYSIASLNQVLFEVEALRRKEILEALMGVNTK